MMCPTRFVRRSCLARISIWALAVTAWLILGAIVSGILRNEVHAHLRYANVAVRALSRCEARAYRSDKSGRFGGVDLELSESQLKGKVWSRSQRMSVACTAAVAAEAVLLAANFVSRGP
jgi:hypothetical protein